MACAAGGAHRDLTPTAATSPTPRPQEDLEMAVAKVMKKDAEKDMSLLKLFK